MPPGASWEKKRFSVLLNLDMSGFFIFSFHSMYILTCYRNTEGDKWFTTVVKDMENSRKPYQKQFKYTVERYQQLNLYSQV